MTPEEIEAEINACRDCRLSRRVETDTVKCEACGHANVSWNHECHHCGAEMPDPGPMPQWMVDEEKADEDYERSAEA